MIFDVIIIAVLLISAVIAFLRGFIREMLTIVGVAGGAAAAYFGGPLLSPTVKSWFGPEEAETVKDGAEKAAETTDKFFNVIPYTLLADIIAYGGIFIAVVVILSIFSHFMATWAKAAGLGIIDRSFGVLFGLARGILLLGLLYSPVYILTEPETRDGWFKDIGWMKGSHTRLYVEETAGWLAKFFPQPSEEEIEAAKKQADALAKDPRKALEDLDVLKKDEEEIAPAENKTEPADDSSGYEQEEREDLNNLFEESTNE